MSKIAIMTDSNSGFLPDDKIEPGIFVLPMPVLINGETFYEGTNLSSEVFYERLRQGDMITTSQPSPGSLMETWKELLKDYDEIVHIPMSSGLSNSCQTAMMLAQEEEFSGRVFVVDNHRISVTQAQSVLDAKKLAEEGYDGASIREILEQEALDATIYISVDTLEYLKKGGRITAAAAAIGTVLHIKPVLTIQGGKLDAFTKTRGMKSAFKVMCKALDRELSTRFASFHKEGCLKVGIAHTEVDTDTLTLFIEEIRERYPDLELFHLPLSMSIGCHTGPGAIGIGLVRCRR